MDHLILCILFTLALSPSSRLVSADFYNDFDITWGNDRAKILDNGQHLQLTLDQSSGMFYSSLVLTAYVYICLPILYMSMLNTSLSPPLPLLYENRFGVPIQEWISLRQNWYANQARSWELRRYCDCILCKSLPSTRYVVLKSAVGTYFVVGSVV